MQARPNFKIRRGLDLPVSGAPEPAVDSGRKVRSVALLGRDYPGLKPRMMVGEGDRVALGDALFVDKRDPVVAFAAPGSGVVTAINRGERRSLLSVVIELDDDGEGDDLLRPHLVDHAVDDTSEARIREVLQSTGLWAAFRARPFSRVPPGDSIPRSIFVTAVDTNPLAANPVDVVRGREADLDAGLAVLSRLTDGSVFLCVGEDWASPVCDRERVKTVSFSGPHPAGLPGTHIHFLDPVGAERTVWHIGYQDVIAMGVLFNTGRLATDRVIALGGPAVERPRLLVARLGASIDELTAGELKQGGAVGPGPRVVSGSVLSGRRAVGPEAFLGRYHTQISAVPRGGERRLLGWLPSRRQAYSLTGAFASRTPRRLEDLTVDSHGTQSALIPIDAFEKVVPLDLLPVPLLLSLLIRDTDQAQALGCLELDAEDLALCSFVCPGKNDYGSVLQANLEQIEREG